MIDVDIAIAGGGLVGATLALLLGQAQLTVALLEPQPPTRTQKVPARVSALSPFHQKLFAEHAIWQELAIKESYAQMSVWDAQGTGRIRFDADSVAYENLGFIIDNEELRFAIWKKVAPTILHISARCTHLINSSQGATCMLDNKQQLRARWLIAADGRDSEIRKQAGITQLRMDGLHHALVATVATHKHHSHKARQVFLDSGPLAFLPLPDHGGRHYCSMVWSLPPLQAVGMLECNKKMLAKSLSAHFEDCYGALELGEMHVFPLRQQHAWRYVKDSVVLVGDSAHCVHPLAGQGLNLGLKDARVLAQLICAQQQNLGQLDLTSYEKKRKVDNIMSLACMESLVHLFAADALPWRWLRNKGLRHIDRMDFIKSFLARQAIGE